MLSCLALVVCLTSCTDEPAVEDPGPIPEGGAYSGDGGYELNLPEGFATKPTGPAELEQFECSRPKWSRIIVASQTCDHPVTWSKLGSLASKLEDDTMKKLQGKRKQRPTWTAWREPLNPYHQPTSSEALDVVGVMRLETFIEPPRVYLVGFEVSHRDHEVLAGPVAKELFSSFKPKLDPPTRFRKGRFEIHFPPSYPEPKSITRANGGIRTDVHSAAGYLGSLAVSHTTATEGKLGQTLREALDGTLALMNGRVGDVKEVTLGGRKDRPGLVATFTLQPKDQATRHGRAAFYLVDGELLQVLAINPPWEDYRSHAEMDRFFASLAVD